VRAQVICFIDSNVALGTLLRGSSRLGVSRASQEGLASSRRQPDWNRLVSGIWFDAASRGHVFGAFRVPSKLNLADAGTRMEDKTAELRAMSNAGFARIEWQWPSDMPGLRSGAKR
jgi:hypothetical protein